MKTLAVKKTEAQNQKPLAQKPAYLKLAESERRLTSDEKQVLVPLILDVARHVAHSKKWCVRYISKDEMQNELLTYLYESNGLDKFKVLANKSDEENKKRFRAYIKMLFVNHFKNKIVHTAHTQSFAESNVNPEEENSFENLIADELSIENEKAEQAFYALVDLLESLNVKLYCNDESYYRERNSSKCLLIKKTDLTADRFSKHVISQAEKLNLAKNELTQIAQLCKTVTFWGLE